jgi:3-oxoacyl-[acyl-carrier protein] reductase
MEPLAGKRALVCGSSQGIGRACAVEFARLGARVTLLARDEEALRKVRDALPAPAGHEILRADFNDPPSVRSAVTEHVGRTGPIQILLNNTGGPPSGPILGAEPESFLTTFSRHVICNQFLVQVLVPGMKESGYGRIINIVSTSVKQPIKDLGVSNTVRAAVAGWAKTLAGELAPHRITVNNLLPGATMTLRLREIIKARARVAGVPEEEIERRMLEEIPAGRFAAPEEVAAAAGFLATPAAAYITGISLPVDGGRTAAL